MKLLLSLLVIAICAFSTSSHRDAFCGHDIMVLDHLQHVNAMHLLQGPFEAQAGTCPTYGRCDDPKVRDSTVIKNINVRIAFNVMCDPRKGCPDGVDTAKVKDQLLQLQMDYEPYNVSFELTGINFINDSDCSNPIRDTRNDWRLAIFQCKEKYSKKSDSQVNIIVTKYTSPQPGTGTLLGFGTFPWYKSVGLDPLGPLGGVWLNSAYTGLAQRTLTHELGHNFGLFHPFQGFEVGVPASKCPTLDCYEAVHPPSDYKANYVGDFCADTPATPVNYNCANPDGTDCYGTPFGNTDFDNYMAYADDSCIDHFSPQQVSRMHCWICDAIGSQTTSGC